MDMFNKTFNTAQSLSSFIVAWFEILSARMDIWIYTQSRGSLIFKSETTNEIASILSFSNLIQMF